MATYDELFGLLHNTELLNKITVAVGVAADAIWNEDDVGAPWVDNNHANRVVWAKTAYANPQVAARQVLWSVIIANRAATAEQIVGAADTAIQSNVNAVVDMFAT